MDSVAQLLAKEEGTALPRMQVEACCWNVRGTNGKPAQAWVMRYPSFLTGEDSVRVGARCLLDLGQAEEFAEALLFYAGQVDPSFREPKIYRRQLGGRRWSVGFEDWISVASQGKKNRWIEVRADHHLPAQVAWEMGSYILALLRQF